MKRTILNLTLIQYKGGPPRILQSFYLKTNTKVLEIVKNKMTVIKKGMCSLSDNQDKLIRILRNTIITRELKTLGIDLDDSHECVPR